MPGIQSSFLWTQFFVKPAYPTHDFTGQTIIVTGSNVGLGLEAARHFTRLNAAKVILAVRNTAAGETAKTSIEQSTKRSNVVEVWHLDLSNYDSVQSFAAKASSLNRLDVLICNAGIATHKFTLAESAESTITVNVLSTFLLALLLLPKLQSTGIQHNITPHLTIVSSEVHGWTSFVEKSHPHILTALSDPEKAHMQSRYPTSKLLEVLIVRHIAPLVAKKYPTVVLNMLNPGFCHSSLAREAGGWTLWFMKLLLARSTEVGSRTLVLAASAGRESHRGYMSDGVVKNEAVSEFARSKEGRRLGRRFGKR